MMAESPEYKAIHSCSYQLKNALLNIDPDLIDFLENNNFIDENVSYKFFLPNTAPLWRFDAAEECVSGIMKKVAQSPANFYIFRKQLTRCGQRYEKIVAKMDEEYAKQQLLQSSTDTNAASPGPATTTSSPAGISPKPSASQAYAALIPVADKWKHIGTLLNLPEGTLESINNENNKDKDKLLAVIYAWLSQIAGVSWRALIDAVAIENPIVAADIEREYSS